MKVKKKNLLYFSLTIILLSSGVAYAAVAKSIWHPTKRAAAEKAETHSAAQAAQSDNAKAEAEALLAPAETATDKPATDTAETPYTTDQKTTDTASANNEKKPAKNYLLHKNISTTYFWAGEEADKDNKNISNLPSAWDDDWTAHFGGVDDPKHRDGYFPSKFTPKENPFYFALPYNDFNSKGKQKNDPEAIAIWGKPKKGDSICKNQWIKITHAGKTVYAQWEDVGPFGENDKAYVFGGATPKSKENSHAGLDVSPAVHDYLGLSDVDKTDWQFVDASDVPDGPWKKIVTTRQVYWP